MLSRIHRQLGTAGFVLSIIALVVALSGAAYAAAKLNNTQKKEVEKIAKKFAGKPGAPGAAGTAGSAGSPGPKGDAGAGGATGAAGKSVTVTPIASGGPKCAEQGGATLKQEGAASGTDICSGKEGSPWTAGGTLPSGETETGSWGFLGPLFGGVKAGVSPITFAIPLADPLEETDVHFINTLSLPADTVPAECAGGTAANPTAEPGNLCVYVGRFFQEEGEPVAVSLNKLTEPFPGASTSGAIIKMGPTTQSEGLAEMWGSWAVTAP